VRVVTNEHITRGAKDAIVKSPNHSVFTNCDFWDNEKLIEYIDEYYQDYWLPGDFISKLYKISILNSIQNEFEIRGLSVSKLPESKMKRLTEIFIKPHLIELSSEKDKRTENKLKHKRVTINDICQSNDNFVIEGDPGSGKTRLVKQIMGQLLDLEIITENKTFPIELKLQKLREEDFDIVGNLRLKVKEMLADETERFNFEESGFIIFIDSIDELYTKEIDILKSNILRLATDSRYRFVLTARSIENIQFDGSKIKMRYIYLRNFNQRQVEQFVEKYFDNIHRGKRLIQVLKNSNILEKLPTTPLTITLISLLYEDNEYEIPATLTDIYKDFVDILLGKLDVGSRVQLLDVEIKRRVFSNLAVQLLREKVFEIKKDDLKKRVKSFLEPKGIFLDDPEDIDRLLINSGLLYIDDNDMVGFKHLSFLEYFSAFEIFHTEKFDNNLVEMFNDVNWQNTAIFYAGFSKDMDWFIDLLLRNAPNKNLRDRLINTGGMGYLCQALYMTSIEERKKLVQQGLDNMLSCFKNLKELTGELGPYYNMPLHILGSILVYWYNMNFRSVTTTRCLETLFNDIVHDDPKQLQEGHFNTGFKLFLLATTLSTEYINKPEKFEELLDYECFVKDPLLVILFEVFLEIEGVDKKKISEKRRKRLKKEVDRYRTILNSITKEPAYRFGGDGYIKTRKKLPLKKE